MQASNIVENSRAIFECFIFWFKPYSNVFKVVLSNNALSPDCDEEHLNSSELCKLCICPEYCISACFNSPDIFSISAAKYKEIDGFHSFFPKTIANLENMSETVFHILHPVHNTTSLCFPDNRCKAFSKAIGEKQTWVYSCFKRKSFFPPEHFNTSLEDRWWQE